MATFSDYTYAINGIVSTDKTVLQNLDILTGACNTWMTYDTHEGLWAVVINQTGTSVASFNDTNILGAIAISGSGIDQLYNSVRVEFPHIDLNDNKDYILDTIPNVNWFPNEIPNTLNMQFDIINDPVQAEYVGLVQLKQGRLDQIIRFASDFSKLGLKAGDLIDITSSTYGFVAKMFRILSIKESDAESGAILLDITAQQYDENVYSTDDLYRYIRTNSTGIATIGNIGVPGTPTVNKTEFDSRPRVTVSSTTPTGTVEAMEFWYTPDTYVYDANRVYTLLETVKPTAGNAFTYGNTITVTNDSLPTGNLYVKTRGINAQTTGPFSTPTGFVYTPVQTTQAISDTTQVSNTGTGSLLTALALTQLLKYVDGLFSGNTAVSQVGGGLFDKMFKQFKSNTGWDLQANNSFRTLTVSNSAAQQGLSVNYKGSGNWEIDYSGKSVTFDSNTAMITWTFNTGSDLDIRCRIYEPSAGQTTVDQYLGYTGNVTAGNSTINWPTTGTPIITWGGDNTGTGTENVLLDLNEFQSQYPSSSSVIIECRGNWWGSVGSTPVKLTGTLWNGGSPSPSGYGWTNSGSPQARQINGLEVFVDSFHGSGTSEEGVGQAGETTLGDLMGYFVYDFTTNKAYFTNTLYD